MINRKLTVFTLLGFMICIISCKNSTSSNVIENKVENEIQEDQVDNIEINSEVSDDSTSDAQTQVDLRASEFVDKLENGGKLSSFFDENWILIYHEDNRCDGSTDGQIDNLKSKQIDTIIRLQVKNDGNGWDCDKKESKSYDLDFDLKKHVANWDRFEISNYENQEKNIIYILGAGESDYLKLHYNDNNLIIKLEYRSEDPG